MLRDLSKARDLRELLGDVGSSQGLDHVFQLAFHYLLQGIEGQADAMVREP